LIGIPSDDRQDVRTRAFDLGKAFASRVPEPDRVAADAAVVWMRDYIRALIHDRPRRGDDLLSRMLDPGDGADRLSKEEVVDNVVFLFFAGFETTTSMIATGCAALLDHPDELARLREDRSLVPSAVEEFLRWDAPIQSRLRLVLEPIEVHGRTIRPGRALLLLLGSANRDEGVFPDAGRLDVGRSQNPHVSFGGGFHHCLGAALARAEGVVVFERLLARFGHLESGGHAARETESPFRTFSKIPIAVQAA
jgi:cytochrome P450